MHFASKGSVKEALISQLESAHVAPSQINEMVGKLINAYFKTAKGQLQDKEATVIAKQILLLAIEEKKLLPDTVMANLRNTWRQQEADEEKPMVSLPDATTRFTPLSMLTQNNTQGFFRLRQLGKQALQQGLLDRTKHYTTSELRDRWYTDRDLLLSMCACFATGKNMSTPELWMIRNIGEPDTSPKSGNLSDDSQASSAAWTHYLGIPHENVISLPGFRTSIVHQEKAHNDRVMRGETQACDYYALRNQLRDQEVRQRQPALVARCQQTFLSEAGFTAESEYKHQPGRLLAPNADLDAEVKAEVEKMLQRVHAGQADISAVTVRQQGYGEVESSAPLRPIILFVYGHYNSNTNSYGGNSMLDMIEQLKWLGLEEIMQRTITIVGISCHSLPVMREMCLQEPFKNAVMACGTLRRIDPFTRRPEEFYSKHFYYYSHSLANDEDKLTPDDLENRPLLPDLFFSLKTGMNSTRAPVMSERFDMDDLAHAFPALEEDPQSLIQAVNTTLMSAAEFKEDVNAVVWQCMGYLSLHKAVRSMVSVDTPLIEQMQAVDAFLHPEKAAKPVPPMAQNHLTKRAAETLADVARKHINWVKDLNLTFGVKPEEAEVRGFLDLLCRRSLVGKKAEHLQVSTKRRERHGSVEKAVSALNVNKNESRVVVSDEAVRWVVNATVSLYGKELMGRLDPDNRAGSRLRK